MVKIHTKAEGLKGVHVPLELMFHLPVSYPLCLPGISVHSEHLTRAQREAVKGKLLEQAAQLVSEPMVHELVLWVQQHLGNILYPPEATGDSDGCPSPPRTTGDDRLWMTLLHLDHMRAKARYTKTVEKWAADLRLTGRLMFLGKIILILLQGDRHNLKVPASAVRLQKAGCVVLREV